MRGRAVSGSLFYGCLFLLLGAWTMVVPRIVQWRIRNGKSVYGAVWRIGDKSGKWGGILMLILGIALLLDYLLVRQKVF